MSPQTSTPALCRIVRREASSLATTVPPSADPERAAPLPLPLCPGQYLSLPMFTPFDRCPPGVAPSESLLCERGAAASDAEDGNLTARVLACPPAACLDRGCPGHEFVTKGLNGCLNVSAEVSATAMTAPT